MTLWQTAMSHTRVYTSKQRTHTCMGKVHEMEEESILMVHVISHLFYAIAYP